MSVAAAFEVARSADKSFVPSPAQQTPASVPRSPQRQGRGPSAASPRAQPVGTGGALGLCVASAGSWGLGGLCGKAGQKKAKRRQKAVLAGVRGAEYVACETACSQEVRVRSRRRQEPARGLSEQPLVQVGLDRVPSDAELRGLFEKLDADMTGTIGLAEIQEVISYLEERFSLGLRAEDDERLCAFLAAGPGAEGGRGGARAPLGVTEGQLVEGAQRLVSSLLPLAETGCRLQQLKVVLVAAFERFDANNDGNISLAEFITAADCMGLELERRAAADVFEFLCPNLDFGISMEDLANERSFEEKWTEAIGRSLEQMRRSKGVDGILDLVARMQAELAREGTWEEKVQRIQTIAWDGISDVCNILELGVDVASVGVALMSLEEILQQAGADSGPTDSDLSNVLPFLTLLGVGALKTAKELDQYVPKDMTEDEAQLYGQILYPYGLSQGQFRQLLACPGFRWATAEPGEVLRRPEDRTLLVLLRGCGQIAHEDEAGSATVLPAGSTVGETFFLHRKSVGRSETVTARQRVVYACWDEEKLQEHLQACDVDLSLRLDTFLTRSMVANFRRTIRLSTKRCPDMTSSQLPFKTMIERLFQTLDTNCDGVVSAEEFHKNIGVLSAALSSDPATMRMFLSKDFSKETISSVLPALCEKFKLGDSDESRFRLACYLELNKNGAVDMKTFTLRLLELQEFTSSLKGLSIRELESIIFRAFQKFDDNGDGILSREEFMQIGRRLNLPLSEKQMGRLFRFFDTDRDGVVRFSEWMAGVGAGLSWGAALSESLREQAKRKGLTEFRALLGELREILEGPEQPVAKASRALAKLMDGGEALAEVLNAGLDAAGAGVAIYAIWREVQGVGSWDDVSDIDLAPFLIFFAILGISAVRRKAEGEASDLTEDQAKLYATGFESHGFTITEFQKVLKYGRARCEELAAGAAASSGRSLRLILAGGCEVRFAGSEASAVLGHGRMLGASRFLGIDLDEVTRAVEPTSILTLDLEALKAYLVHDESLHMRFNRLAARSMAHAFAGGEAA